MGELSKLPNIGKKLEEQLIQSDIHTSEKLRAVGAKAAWPRILEKDESACILRLMAIEGAIRGINKNLLPDDVKTYPPTPSPTRQRIKTVVK